MQREFDSILIQKGRVMFDDNQIDPGTVYLKEIGLAVPDADSNSSENYEWEILRQVCNYVAAKGQYFGNTILELGCGAGYLTGFLAKTFPDSKIVAIDSSEQAISMAEKRIADLHIENVEFRNCSVGDVDGLFDTVVCIGTLHENLDEEVLPYPGEPLLYQFAVSKKMTRDYTRFLTDRLKESGTLCVFERLEHDPLLCGWLLELESIPCGIMLDTYEEMYLREAETVISTYQAFVARKGHKNTTKQVLDMWYAPVNHYDASMLQLNGYKALDYLNRNAGALIRGYRIFDDKSGRQIGRFALFKDCDDDIRIYLLVSTGDVDNITVVPYDWSIEEELLDKLQEMALSNEKLGFRYEEIDPSDSILEGKIRIGFVKKY